MRFLKGLTYKKSRNGNLFSDQEFSSTIHTKRITLMGGRDLRGFARDLVYLCSFLSHRSNIGQEYRGVDGRPNINDVTTVGYNFW